MGKRAIVTGGSGLIGLVWVLPVVAVVASLLATSPEPAPVADRPPEETALARSTVVCPPGGRDLVVASTAGASGSVDLRTPGGREQLEIEPGTATRTRVGGGAVVVTGLDDLAPGLVKHRDAVAGHGIARRARAHRVVEPVVVVHHHAKLGLAVMVEDRHRQMGIEPPDHLGVQGFPGTADHAQLALDRLGSLLGHISLRSILLDDRFGSRVSAVVAPRGGKEPSLESIQEQCRTTQNPINSEI